MNSSSRYALDAAPDPLHPAQELINTIGIGRHEDLLGDLTAAEQWATTALTEADLDLLRAFRTDLQALVSQSGEPTRDWTSEVTLTLGPAVVLETPGDGAQPIIAKTLAGIFEAQLLDTWRRLKTCRNPACGAAFYDRSRPNSRVWHSLTMCGNPANLRAHRARSRGTSG
ncbi:CGNR zinc finger domain-containing protein [Kribbella sp. NPDC058245]|uniref:CGNR zinc finger domain-containing protein n=1 Tax=Kribbella sp. NPDC058245 TaxID=3346399 RepID=UPI0036EFC122